MALRPKPQMGDPTHSSYAVWRQSMDEWVADAMQDAADRIEQAVYALAEAKKQPTSCERYGTHMWRTAGVTAPFCGRCGLMAGPR